MSAELQKFYVRYSSLHATCRPAGQTDSLITQSCNDELLSVYIIRTCAADAEKKLTWPQNSCALS